MRLNTRQHPEFKQSLRRNHPTATPSNRARATAPVSATNTPQQHQSQQAVSAYPPQHPYMQYNQQQSSYETEYPDLTLHSMTQQQQQQRRTSSPQQQPVPPPPTTPLQMQQGQQQQASRMMMLQQSHQLHYESAAADQYPQQQQSDGGLLVVEVDLS
jgi:hypothetical protein